MSDLTRLAQRIRALEGTVRNLATSPQLAASSIVDGAIDQVENVQVGTDHMGNPLYESRVVSRYGLQDDGSNTVVSFDGPTPPRPIGHTVTGGAGFIAVEWFGEFEDRYEPYDDHDYVAVHIGGTSGFTPTADTLKATIRARQGESTTIGGLSAGTYYVTLVAVSVAGVWGPPSPFADGDSGEPSGIDVTARQMAADALAAAMAAASDATAALAAADGKTTLWYSTAAPTAGDGADGDTWWQRDPATGLITGAWEKRSGAWESRELTSAVIDSLTAAKITTGTLATGVAINVGDPSGQHTAIGGTGIVTYRNNPDGDLVPATIVGGTSEDTIQIVDPTDGSTLAGFFADGSGMARSFSANRMHISGAPIGDMEDPEDLLWHIPRGAVGSFQTMTSGGEAGQNPLGAVEVAAMIQTGRLYRVTFSGTLLWRTSGGIVRIQITDTFDGTPPGVTPQPGRTARYFANAYMPIASSQQLNMSAYFVAPDTGTIGEWVTYRCLFSTWAAFSGYTIQAFANSSMPMSIVVEDLGPMGDQFMRSGQMSGGGGQTSGGAPQPPPAQPVKTRTTSYVANWSRTFRGDGSIRTDSGDVFQGYQSAHGLMRSMIGFPAQMQTDLAGSTISKIEVYLYAYHWYNGSGGTAVIGVHGQAGPPSSFSYSGGLNVANWPRDAFRWVTLPRAWYAAFATGVNKGITLGGGLSSNSGLYYGRFYPHTKAGVQPKLRITYTK